MTESRSSPTRRLHLNLITAIETTTDYADNTDGPASGRRSDQGWPLTRQGLRWCATEIGSLIPYPCYPWKLWFLN